LRIQWRFVAALASRDCFFAGFCWLTGILISGNGEALTEIS
jgi:hypothetical protein